MTHEQDRGNAKRRPRRRGGRSGRPPQGGRPPIKREPLEPPPRGYTSALDDDDDLDFDFFDDETPDEAPAGRPPTGAAPPADGDQPRKRRRRRRGKGKPPAPEAAAPAAPAAPPREKPPVRPPREGPRPAKPPHEKPRPAKPPADEAPPPREAKPPREARPPRARPAKPRPAAEPKSAQPPVEPKPAPTAPPAPVAEKRPPPAERKPPRRHAPTSGFMQLGLSPEMLDILAEVEYLEPTPVQSGLIPRALAGVDVMAQARTGTGKTAAFAIPILDRVEPGERGAPPRALVLVPTRELAVQVRDECVRLAGERNLRVAAVYGGKPIRQQADALHRGVELLVGTPGRVIDLLNRGLLLLRDLRWVVLDEADRMLDIGFRPDIEKILRRCPTERQTMLLSATIPPPVKRLAERYMRSPEMVDCSVEDVAVETIEQFYFSVDPEQKFDLLVRLLQRDQPAQAIIFCRTKRGTDKLYHKLRGPFPHVDTIHGDLNQSARDRVMERFRAGRTTLLVATDVVGRGIDVTSISHIVNFDVPQFCDDYVHRVGRTGRMGREGVAYTFVTPEEGNELTRIEMRINRLLKRDEVPGFVALAKPEPNEALDDGEAESAPKPVYGKRTRRYRRAL
jgi:ATP-dependent RNA helicase DeaD